MRIALRRFVETEVRPRRKSLEYGDEPPYALLRKMYEVFGLSDTARERFERTSQLNAQSTSTTKTVEEAETRAASGLIPLIELSRCSPGMVTALGVSVGLTASAILARGTDEQKRRWALDLLTMDKIGSWAITEPGSGSDAFGSMYSTARREGSGYVINGTKTFITNAPHADLIVFICRLDDGGPSEGRPVVSFVLHGNEEGLERSQPLQKMGMHSSPTGELFLTDVRVEKDQLIGETEPIRTGHAAVARDAAKATFARERATISAIALGIIERCIELSTQYANDRIQFGRPIGEYQLIQLKLAQMEVHRLNVEGLVFRHLSLAARKRSLSIEQASAMKLYAARAAVETAMEAVQLFGGNGYMAEFEVEQLARDAKVLQIYGGTDEIQVTHIARGLLKK